jgi:hypothetical protein
MKQRKIDDNILLDQVKAGVKQKEIAKFFKVSPVAVCKRLKRLIPPPNLDHLTDKRRAFVVKVSQGNSATSAAMQTFACKDRKSGKVLGSQLMKEPEINEGIKAVMDYWGLTRSYRVQRLKGHVDHRDPNISLKALDQSWRLDGYVEKHLNVGIDIQAINQQFEEAKRELAVIEKKILERTGKTPKELIEVILNTKESGD